MPDYGLIRGSLIPNRPRHILNFKLVAKPMTSIIVFSKDRPLQLHGYLESLLKYSDTEQSGIAIILKETDAVDYSRTIESFPMVKWIKESDFSSDLMSCLNAAKSDHVMFGVDDVVFIKPFQFKTIETFLRNNNDVFGFSLRLGNNIKPLPKRMLKEENYLTWDWTTTNARHYNYPWELCSTVYRKTDVIELVSKNNNAAKSPNYLEDMVACRPKELIARKMLACFNDASKSLVVTVNAVQTTHPNGFDNRQPTDIFTLNNLYNNYNNRLDIERISNKGNKKVHVGTDYFILVRPMPDWSKRKKKQSKKSLKTFLKNLSYLFRYNIKDLDRIDDIIDNIHYESVEIVRPKILNPADTISAVIEKKASFCRFGDGEIGLMKGDGIPFQVYDEELSNRLFEVFQSDLEDVFIGIPYFVFNPSDDFESEVKRFVRAWGPKNRPLINSITIPGKTYYDAACTQLYASYQQYDFHDHFLRVQEIWRNRDITLICGQSVFSHIKNNIFDTANSVTWQYAPARNAYSEYQSILEKAKSSPDNHLIIIILGPTATVLAYDLAIAGYQALDLGHLAKDYDYYLRGVQRDASSLRNFFSPD